MDAWTKTRERAIARRRRIIMNNDGDDVFRAREATPESFLAERCSGLEGSHVDAIFYSTCVNFGVHSHDSRCAQIYDIEDEVICPRNHAREFIRQGRDNLQMIIDFCRANGMEAFWSLRMNDTHDNWYPFFLMEFKRSHPELLLFQPSDVGRGRQGLVEPHMYATAVDYGREEIRDMQFEIIRDVCERCDVEGIELDFLRNPILFRPTMEGLPVEQEHIDIMSSFLRRVREMTERVGRSRGRPLLIACRVPNVPALARNIGLDVELWLREDLIDILVASLEDAPFTGDLSEIVALGHGHGRPVYACLSVPGDTDKWIAATMNALNAGADGIQTFNEFNPHWPIWRILGDPAAMARMDKTFAVDNKDYRTKEHVVPREGRLPIELPAGRAQRIRLPVADDAAACAARGDGPRLLITIKVERLTWRDKVEFRLNGTLLDTEVFYATEGISPAACGTFMFHARPEPARLIKGDNILQAVVRRPAGPVQGDSAISEVELHVRYCGQ